MKKFVVFTIVMSVLVGSIFAQNNSVTNNTTITINGNVYYFKPSTSQSSPLPQVNSSSNWIGDGEWWGRDAARAWASIVDWTVMHCTYKNNNGTDPDILASIGYNVYINRITAKRNGNTREAEITIYYWIVARGKKMEAGEPKKQRWSVEF
jgi:hypothetical protein